MLLLTRANERLDMYDTPDTKFTQFYRTESELIRRFHTKWLTVTYDNDFEGTHNVYQYFFPVGYQSIIDSAPSVLYVATLKNYKDLCLRFVGSMLTRKGLTFHNALRLSRVNHSYLWWCVLKGVETDEDLYNLILQVVKFWGWDKSKSKSDIFNEDLCKKCSYDDYYKYYKILSFKLEAKFLSIRNGKTLRPFLCTANELVGMKFNEDTLRHTGKETKLEDYAVYRAVTDYDVSVGEDKFILVSIRNTNDFLGEKVLITSDWQWNVFYRPQIADLLKVKSDIGPELIIFLGDLICQANDPSNGKDIETPLRDIFKAFVGDTPFIAVHGNRDAPVEDFGYVANGSPTRPLKRSDSSVIIYKVLWKGYKILVYPFAIYARTQISGHHQDTYTPITGVSYAVDVVVSHQAMHYEKDLVVDRLPFIDRNISESSTLIWLGAHTETTKDESYYYAALTVDDVSCVAINSSITSNVSGPATRPFVAIDLKSKIVYELSRDVSDVQKYVFK